MPELEKKSKQRSTFKSPLPKLVKFFEKSRDKWKARSKEAKYKAKLLSNQVYYLKNQNAKLKQHIKKLEEELRQSGEKKT
jgi:lipopolysaccharide export system protein LptC